MVSSNGSPPSFPSAEAEPVILCFGVVNEADIIRSFLEYHLAIGIDLLIATDVGSTDGTLDILAEYERYGCLHLMRRTDPSARPERADWLTAMANRASQFYPRGWRLFGDADEFWIFPRNNARAYFSEAPAPIVIFPRLNIVPVDPATGLAAHFTRSSLVVRNPLSFGYNLSQGALASEETLLCASPPEILRKIAPKVAVRQEVIASIVPGFHDVVANDPSAPRYHEPAAYIAHYPIRSVEQWKAKAGMVSRYIANNPPEVDRYVGGHWVRLASILKLGLIEKDFSRQVLTQEEIRKYLGEGVLERVESLESRLALNPVRPFGS